MKRLLCSKLKATHQDKNGFWRLQLTLHNLKISKHKSNCQRPHERCSRSKFSISFLCNVRNPVLCLQFDCSFLFIFVFRRSDFKFRLQIIFCKFLYFHSCSMCATPCFVCHGGKTSSHVASGTKTFWAPVLCQCTAKKGQILFDVAFEFS